MSTLIKTHKYLFLIILLMSAITNAQMDAETWFERAVAAREARQPEDALTALSEAEALGLSPVRVALERARVGVIAGDPDMAVQTLRGLAATGFTGVGLLTGDSVLSLLAGHADYDALVTELSVQAYPCEHDAAFAAFDFWIGDWDVHIASGAFAGSNSIRREQRGCVLIENWKSVSGGGGMSINYLDKLTDEWVQIWNDEGGNQINIRGGMTADGMLLTGTIHYIATGTTAPFRGLWTPLDDGRVRQFFEQSNDDGETWATWFEGFYTRADDTRNKQ